MRAGDLETSGKGHRVQLANWRPKLKGEHKKLSRRGLSFIEVERRQKHTIGAQTWFNRTCLALITSRWMFFMLVYSAAEELRKNYREKRKNKKLVTNCCVKRLINDEKLDNMWRQLDMNWARSEWMASFDQAAPKLECDCSNNFLIESHLSETSSITICKLPEQLTSFRLRGRKKLKLSLSRICSSWHRKSSSRSWRNNLAAFKDAIKVILIPSRRVWNAF